MQVFVDAQLEFAGVFFRGNTGRQRAVIFLIDFNPFFKYFAQFMIHFFFVVAVTAFPNPSGDRTDIALIFVRPFDNFKIRALFFSLCAPFYLAYRLTRGIQKVTIDYMKLLMDADCLIKLTKAGLKELVCRHDAVVIPSAVEKEVVDAGKAKGCTDAFIVEKNIASKALSVIMHAEVLASGDSALAELFAKGRYDAVATDDSRLTRRLRALDIPFILPGLILYRLFKDGCIDKKKAVRTLKKLAEFISDDEYSTVRLLMEKIS